MIHTKDAAALVQLDYDNDSGFSYSEESDLRLSAIEWLPLRRSFQRWAAQFGSRTSLAAMKRQGMGRGMVCWVLTACEEELVALHTYLEEGEPLVEEQAAVCDHGMGISAAGAPGVAPTRTLLSGLWKIKQEDLTVLLRLEQESVDAVVMVVARKTLQL